MKEVNLLSVPYTSQIGSGANEHGADCGAASASMLIKAYLNKTVPVDALYNLVSKEINGYLSINQVQGILSYYGITTEWRSDMSKYNLINILIDAKPCIVLFNYAAFRQKYGKTSDMNFNGAHFSVMMGVDTRCFYLNDPDWLDQNGYALAIKHDSWMYAWKAAASDGNPVCGAIIPTVSLDGIVVDPTNDGAEIIYTVRILARIGLFIRTSPKKTVSNYTGKAIAYNKTVDIYKESKDGNNLWGAINSNCSEWIALVYGNEVLAEET